MTRPSGLVLDEDQCQIQQSAARFFHERLPVSELRKRRLQRDFLYSLDVWESIVEMGFAAATLPAEHGGLGLGFSTLGIVFEEAGRTLAATPLMSTIVGGASAIELAGTPEQAASYLPRIAAGRMTLALALDEGPRHDPSRIKTFASRRDGGYLLSGKKQFVLDGASASALIVVARSDVGESSEAISLFLVDRYAPNVHIARTAMVDSSDMAHITFDNVLLGRDALLGVEGGAYQALDNVLDRLRVCLAAEMLGGVLTLFEKTVSYLKDREQFGVKIGSFQALQHRAARMFIEVELTRSTIRAALCALDDGGTDARALASLAKARANDCYRLVSNEAVQMHGGIGVTDALDVGLYLKRARVAAQLFGDSRYNTDRFARLSGY